MRFLTVPTLVVVDLICFEGRLVYAFSCFSPTRARSMTTKAGVEAKATRGLFSRQHQLLASLPSSGFFFSEEEENDDNDISAAEEWRVDTRMVNGSWSNMNQFPSQYFPQPIPEEEVQVVEDSPPTPPISPEMPSFLSVDGNGTGGLMRRARGTGGANPSLMVPSDVNPNMRMATPIDSGKETKKIESSHPSAVVSYEALSGLTQSTAIEGKESSGTTQSSASKSESIISTNSHSQKFQQQQRRLIPFEGTSLMDETIHKPSDSRGNSFHPSSHNKKVKQFRGDISDKHRGGFTTPEKHFLKAPLDHNHHTNNIDVISRKDTSSNPKSESMGRQHPQQHAPLSVTRLVPFKGGSLMEEINRGAHGKTRIQSSKLVKFDGLSEMERQRLLQNQEESRPPSDILQHNSRKLVPYRKPVPKSEPIETNTYPSGKVVLYNKQASVAPSVVQSRKREYYYVQYRPPTDATMARKTGLQVNTPISLWNERDTFLDS